MFCCGVSHVVRRVQTAGSLADLEFLTWIFSSQWYKWFSRERWKVFYCLSFLLLLQQITTNKATHIYYWNWVLLLEFRINFSFQNFIYSLLPPGPLRIEEYQRKEGTETKQDRLGPSQVQKPLCPSFFLSFFFFWPLSNTCGILVPWPGIKPGPPALEVQSLIYRTTREVPHVSCL